jgi:hypothetical protein
VGSVLTAEVAAADGAGDNDADGSAEGDDNIGGQYERRLRRSSKRGLKDWERRRLAVVVVHQGGRFCIASTLALRKKKGQVGIRGGGVVPITTTKGLVQPRRRTEMGACRWLGVEPRESGL